MANGLRYLRVGADSAWEQYKPEAEKSLLMVQLQVEIWTAACSLEFLKFVFRSFSKKEKSSMALCNHGAFSSRFLSTLDTALHRWAPLTLWIFSCYR
jgi:hypothetical protein